MHAADQRRKMHAEPREQHCMRAWNYTGTRKPPKLHNRRSCTVQRTEPHGKEIELRMCEGMSRAGLEADPRGKALGPCMCEGIQRRCEGRSAQARNARCGLVGFQSGFSFKIWELSLLNIQSELISFLLSLPKYFVVFFFWLCPN